MVYIKGQGLREIQGFEGDTGVRGWLRANGEGYQIAYSLNPNELYKLNKLNGPNKPNELNELNKLNKPNKPNKLL